MNRIITHPVDADQLTVLSDWPHDGRYALVAEADIQPGMDGPPIVADFGSHDDALKALHDLRRAQQDATARADLVAGLRALADFIETTPAAPTPTFTVRATHYYPLDRDAFLAAVEAMDAELRIPTESYRKDLIEAFRTFGPVEYEVHAKQEVVGEARTVQREEYVLLDVLAARLKDAA